MSEDSIERDGIKWGAEISVVGQKPDWLDDQQKVWFRNTHGHQDSREADAIWFGNVTAIRLPADHPYYAKQQPQHIDPALVERMVALVKDLAIEAREPVNSWFHHWVEARDIIKALEPIDPDLLEARRCVVKAYESIGRKDLALQADSGKMDSRLRVQACLAAIKRGRELETEA